MLARRRRRRRTGAFAAAGIGRGDTSGADDDSGDVSDDVSDGDGDGDEQADGSGGIISSSPLNSDETDFLEACVRGEHSPEPPAPPSGAGAGGGGAGTPPISWGPGGVGESNGGDDSSDPVSCAARALANCERERGMKWAWTCSESRLQTPQKDPCA